MLEASEAILSVIRLADGSVLIQAGGGLSAQLKIDGRAQVMACCSPFVYVLTEQAVLYIFSVEMEEDSLEAVCIAQKQLDQ